LYFFFEESSENPMIATIIELVIVFLVSFGFNLIPFFGPSNLFIASTAALALQNPDMATLVTVGVLIALGATLAKGIHYMVTFFVGKHLSEKRRALLDSDAKKIRKWAFFLLYISAASPIPDEPIVIPLGLMKYSPAKFFIAYLLGKLTITIPGAILADTIGNAFSGWLSQEAMVVISIVLTIIVTVILFKVDFGKLAERFRKKKPAQKDAVENLEKIN
jgi:membrane protein DedA with SNARE-associated domain